MTVTFENQNDIIVYTPEKIICYATCNHNVIVALCIWWCAVIVGLQEWLIIHTNILRIQREVSHIPSTTNLTLATVHSNRVYHMLGPKLSDCNTSDLEEHSQDYIVKNCNEFLLELQGQQKRVAKKSRKQQ
jgi:hypothetical protein